MTNVTYAYKPRPEQSTVNRSIFFLMVSKMTHSEEQVSGSSKYYIPLYSFPQKTIRLDITYISAIIFGVNPETLKTGGKYLNMCLEKVSRLDS